jgi:mannosidase alpha-like ER degradation enhancer 2
MTWRKDRAFETRLGVICILFLFISNNFVVIYGKEFIRKHERAQIKEAVKEMFYHGYNSYMTHAFPKDELKPLSCTGYDTWGSYSLTLIDALDTLVVMGNKTEFEKGVWWLVENLNFDKDKNVSLFETNIRVVGGLLSAHLLAAQPDLDLFQTRPYNNELLPLVVDLVDRLLPAFETPTRMPYCTINLRSGVPVNETTVTATACVGTLVLEFVLLSRLTGDPKYETAAVNALQALWNRRSTLNLVGNHIDISSGIWTHKDAGIGSGIDSFYEYLLKASVLFNDDYYMDIFEVAYKSALEHLKKGHWYVQVSMDQALMVWPHFNSLQGFWPGMQALYGDVDRGAETLHSFHTIVRRFGFPPEGFDLTKNQLVPGQEGYPLRPEMAESYYYMSLIKKDPIWYTYGLDLFRSLEGITRTKCGYAAVKDVSKYTLEDRMDSFFLAETCKYLYLLFDEDNFVNDGNYIFNTEGHLFPVDIKFMSGSAKNVLVVGTNMTQSSVNTTSTVLYEFVNNEEGDIIDEEVIEFDDDVDQFVDIEPDETEENEQDEEKFEEKVAKNPQCKWTYKRRMISEDFKFDQLNR